MTSLTVTVTLDPGVNGWWGFVIVAVIGLSSFACTLKFGWELGWERRAWRWAVAAAVLFVAMWFFTLVPIGLR